MKNYAGLSLLLSALILLSSCQSTEPKTEAETLTSDTTVHEIEAETSTDTEKIDLYAELRGIDAEGENIHMLLREEFVYEFVADEEKGEMLNDTVYARNRDVEELLNVTLSFQAVPGSFSKQGQFISAFVSSIQANDGSIDLVSSAANYMLPLTIEGYFRNLMNTPGVDIEAPWYAQRYIDAMTVQDRLYLTAGSASINLLENMGVLFFNKNMLANFSFDEPYNLVREGNWTFDELNTLVQNSYVDLNGNGRADIADTLGYLTYGNMINAQLVSMGHAYIVKDEEGIPHFTETLSERAVDRYNLVEKFINQLSSTHFYIDPSNDALQATTYLLKYWNEGNVLFFPQVLSAAASMRENEFDFGVLPLPKQDSDQENYLTFVLENVTVMGIPVDQTTQISAYTLEALSIYGYETLSTVYYDVVLKDKYSRDSDTNDMLDIIREGVTFEYPLDTQFMATCIQNKWPIVSTYTMRQPGYAQRFDELVEGWLSLE